MHLPYSGYNENNKTYLHFSITVLSDHLQVTLLSTSLSLFYSHVSSIMMLKNLHTLFPSSASTWLCSENSASHFKTLACINFKNLTSNPLPPEAELCLLSHPIIFLINSIRQTRKKKWAFLFLSYKRHLCLSTHSPIPNSGKDGLQIKANNFWMSRGFSHGVLYSVFLEKPLHDLCPSMFLLTWTILRLSQCFLPICISHLHGWLEWESER